MIRATVDITIRRDTDAPVLVEINLPGDSFLDVIPWPTEHWVNNDQPGPPFHGWRRKQRRAAGVVIRFVVRY